MSGAFKRVSITEETGIKTGEPQNEVKRRGDFFAAICEIY
jgi:hypothetical protein